MLVGWFLTSTPLYTFHVMSALVDTQHDPASLGAVICPWSQMVSGIYITGGLGGHGTGGFNDLWISEDLRAGTPGQVESTFRFGTSGDVKEEKLIQSKISKTEKEKEQTDKIGETPMWQVAREARKHW